MRFSTIFNLILSITVAYGAPTVYLCGDSTMANGGSSGTSGWGPYLSNHVSIPVVNKAIGGRSSRSFTREGRFQEVANLVKSGDIVVIAFGHNDGGGVQNPDNGRGTVVGTGDETVTSTYNGVSEVVHTYPWYIKNAANLMKSKGAIVIIATPTTRNGWDAAGQNISPCNRFCEYAKLSASATGSLFVDHYAFVQAAYKKLGKSVVDTFYPNDQLHTSPAGAKVVAEAFWNACVDAKNVLSQYPKNASSPVASPKTSPATSPKTSPATSPTSTANCVAKWNQCGGQTYTGATCCVSGSTCKFVNSYYSQCQ